MTKTKNTFAEKAIAVILAIATLLTFTLGIGFSANASNLVGANIKDGKLIGYYGEGGDITIPDTVTQIAEEAFKDNDNVTSVTIPGSVNSIGYSAFEGCTKLKKVIFSDNDGADLTIRVSAFNDCAKLEEITIPACAKYVTGNVFKGCSSLKEIKVDKDNPYYYSQDGVFFGPDVVEGEPQYNDKTHYTLIAYPGGKDAGTYTVPSTVNGRTVNQIWASAFRKCKNLTGIEIAPTVTKIGGNAFEESGLKKVTIPNTVLTDEYGNSGWFEGCTDLTDVNLANSITDIGNAMFSGCTSLQRITMNGAVKLGMYSFKDCKSLTNLILPDSLKSIGTAVFEGSENLQRVYVPASVISFPNDDTVGALDAFSGTSSDLLVYVVSGSEGEKYAFNSAKDFGWKYKSINASDLATVQDGDFSLIDMGKKVKVKGAFLMGTTLNVNELTQGEEYNTAAGTANTKAFKTYGISLLPASAKAPAKMNLSIGIPAGIKTSGTKLYKIDGSKAAEITAPISSKTFITDVTSLGTFAVIGDKDTSVISDQPVDAESVELSVSEASVKTGKSIMISSTVLPENAKDKSLTWTSSDDNVATVSGGLVRGIAPGKVTISATTVNGLKAECTVTVIDASAVCASEAKLNVGRKADKNGNINFGFVLTDPSRIATIELNFETAGSDVSVSGENGFTLLGTKDNGDGTYTAVLSYLGEDKLFSADGDNEVAKISAKGETPSAAIKDVKIAGWKLDEKAIYGTIDNIDTRKVTFVKLSPYDFNEDGKVDESDLEAAEKNYRVAKDDSEYKTAAVYDVNSDGIIDVEDFVIISSNIE